MRKNNSKLFRAFLALSIPASAIPTIASAEWSYNQCYTTILSLTTACRTSWLTKASSNIPILNNQKNQVAAAIQNCAFNGIVSSPNFRAAIDANISWCFKGGSAFDNFPAQPNELWGRFTSGPSAKSKLEALHSSIQNGQSSPSQSEVLSVLAQMPKHLQEEASLRKKAADLMQAPTLTGKNDATCNNKFAQLVSTYIKKSSTIGEFKDYSLNTLNAAKSSATQLSQDQNCKNFYSKNRSNLFRNESNIQADILSMIKSADSDIEEVKICTSAISNWKNKVSALGNPPKSTTENLNTLKALTTFTFLDDKSMEASRCMVYTPALYEESRIILSKLATYKSKISSDLKVAAESKSGNDAKELEPEGAVAGLGGTETDEAKTEIKPNKSLFSLIPGLGDDQPEVTPPMTDAELKDLKSRFSLSYPAAFANTKCDSGDSDCYKNAYNEAKAEAGRVAAVELDKKDPLPVSTGNLTPTAKPLTVADFKKTPEYEKIVAGCNGKQSFSAVQKKACIDDSVKWALKNKNEELANGTTQDNTTTPPTDITEKDFASNNPTEYKNITQGCEMAGTNHDGSRTAAAQSCITDAIKGKAGTGQSDSNKNPLAENEDKSWREIRDPVTGELISKCPLKDPICESLAGSYDAVREAHNRNGQNTNGNKSPSSDADRQIAGENLEKELNSKFKETKNLTPKNAEKISADAEKAYADAGCLRDPKLSGCEKILDVKKRADKFKSQFADNDRVAKDQIEAVRQLAKMFAVLSVMRGVSAYGTNIAKEKTAEAIKNLRSSDKPTAAGTGGGGGGGSYTVASNRRNSAYSRNVSASSYGSRSVSPAKSLSGDDGNETLARATITLGKGDLEGYFKSSPAFSEAKRAFGSTKLSTLDGYLKSGDPKALGSFIKGMSETYARQIGASQFLNAANASGEDLGKYASTKAKLIGDLFQGGYSPKDSGSSIQSQPLARLDSSSDEGNDGAVAHSSDAPVEEPSRDLSSADEDVYHSRGGSDLFQIISKRYEKSFP
jgi:hypothetical protein